MYVIYTRVAVVRDGHTQGLSIVAGAAERLALVLHHLDVLDVDVDGGLAGATTFRIIFRPVVRVRVVEGFVVLMAVLHFYDFIFCDSTFVIILAGFYISRRGQ